MLLRLIEVFVIFVSVWATITQILIPFIRGTVFFPIFRKEQKLEKEMARAKQDKVEKVLKREVNKIGKYCVTCKFPESLICKRKNSPHYNFKITSQDTCGLWEERID